MGSHLSRLEISTQGRRVPTIHKDIPIFPPNYRDEQINYSFVRMYEGSLLSFEQYVSKWEPA